MNYSITTRDLKDLTEGIITRRPKRWSRLPKKPKDIKIIDHWNEHQDILETSRKFKTPTLEVKEILEKSGLL